MHDFFSFRNDRTGLWFAKRTTRLMEVVYTYFGSSLRTPYQLRLYVLARQWLIQIGFGYSEKYLGRIATKILPCTVDANIIVISSLSSMIPN